MNAFRFNQGLYAIFRLGFSFHEELELKVFEHLDIYTLLV